jgi:hypothetical protein
MKWERTRNKLVLHFINLNSFSICGPGFELRTYTLSHSTSPFLWWVSSRQGLMNYLPSWLWTVILLISAFWVARTTVVSHQCLAKLTFPRQYLRHLHPQVGVGRLGYNILNQDQPVGQPEQIVWETTSQKATAKWTVGVAYVVEPQYHPKTEQTSVGDSHL